MRHVARLVGTEVTFPVGPEAAPSRARDDDCAVGDRTMCRFPFPDVLDAQHGVRVMRRTCGKIDYRGGSHHVASWYLVDRHALAIAMDWRVHLGATLPRRSEFSRGIEIAVPSPATIFALVTPR